MLHTRLYVFGYPITIADNANDNYFEQSPQNQIQFDCYIPPLDTMLYHQCRQGPVEPTVWGNPWSRNNTPLPQMQNVKICCGFFQTEFPSYDRRQYSDRYGSKFANKYRWPLNIESQGVGGRDQLSISLQSPISCIHLLSSHLSISFRTCV
jgi:hypothetical protein